MTNNREIPCPKCGKMVPCDSEQCQYCGSLMDCAEATLIPGLNDQPYNKNGEAPVTTAQPEGTPSFAETEKAAYSEVGDLIDEGNEEKTQFDISAYDDDSEGDEERTRLNIEAMDADVSDEKPNFVERRPGTPEAKRHASGESPRHAPPAGEETGLCQAYDDSPRMNVKKLMTGLMVGLLVIASLGFAGYGLYYYIDSLEDDEPVHENRQEIKAPANHDNAAANHDKAEAQKK